MIPLERCKALRGYISHAIAQAKLVPVDSLPLLRINKTPPVHRAITRKLLTLMGLAVAQSHRRFCGKLKQHEASPLAATSPRAIVKSQSTASELGCNVSMH